MALCHCLGEIMNLLQKLLSVLGLIAALGFPSRSLAGKSYSGGGGHSYSSHSSSSHSSSFGGSHSFSSSGSRSSSPSRSSSGGGSSKSFTSSSGKSYGASSKSNDDGRHGYTATKSYSSGPSHTFSPGNGGSPPAPNPARNSRPNNSSSDLTFDTAAARARKEQASKEQFSRFKEDSARSAAGAPSYGAKPPPIPSTGNGSYHRTVYVPDTVVIRTRPTRIYNFYSPYWSRPVIYYHDPYNSFFWWWLLDRSLDDQAWWAYHHRYDMDPARYDALLARDQQLQARVTQLEAQQVPRDPNYVPQGVDRDLMYSDQYVNRAYHNRPTTSGAVAFWLLGIPTAVAVCAFFIWLIWFKRWQTATT